MYYRVLAAPPGYPCDQNYLLSKYTDLNYDSCCDRISNTNGTNFFETIEEARGMLPQNARQLPFEPEN